MIYAVKENGERIKATKGENAFCTCCGEKLIPKCGEINIWHWSHSNKSNCQYSGKMTDWHIAWQDRFEEKHREVRVNTKDGYKIADIKLDSGIVIEFQNSPINSEEIRKREEVYNDMIWVLNYDGKSENLMFNSKKQVEIIGDNIKKSFYVAKKPIFLSLKDNYIYDVSNKRILCVENSKTRVVSESEAQIKLFVKRYDYRKELEFKKNICDTFNKNKNEFLIKNIIELNKDVFIDIYNIIGRDYKTLSEVIDNTFQFKAFEVASKTNIEKKEKQLKESSNEEKFVSFNEQYKIIKEIW